MVYFMIKNVKFTVKQQNFEKPYKCEYCDVFYTLPSELIKCILRHKNDLKGKTALDKTISKYKKIIDIDIYGVVYFEDKTKVSFRNVKLGKEQKQKQNIIASLIVSVTSYLWAFLNWLKF